MSQQQPIATNYYHFCCQLVQTLVTPLRSILHYVALYSR